MAKYIIINSSGLNAEANSTSTSSGVADADKIVSTSGTGFLDATLFPPGFGQEVVTVQASENLTAGDMVNLWNNSGSLRVRKADASAASASRRCDGFVSAGVTSGADATVYTGEGDILSGLSGLTPGSIYFLSGTTAGGITTTPVTTSGHLNQVVGKAISTTELLFKPDANPAIRA